jgi:betaine-aldehyde dehydrogenase
MNQQAPVVNTTKVRWPSGSGDDQFAVENPATGQVVTVVQGSGPDEVDQAVRAAIAALESVEMGKPITMARFRRGIGDRYRRVLRSLVEVLPSQARDYGPVFDVTTLEPYGVIAGSRDSRDRLATGGWTVRITDVNERGRIRHV